MKTAKVIELLLQKPELPIKSVLQTKIWLELVVPIMVITDNTDQIANEICPEWPGVDPTNA